MPSTIRHVVFDIGRVLLHWDPEIPYRRLIPDEQQRRRFLDTVCNGAWNIEQDRGRTWADAETELIGQHPEHEILIRAYRKHWLDMIPYALTDNLEQMQLLLERSVDVTLLTNWSQETFPLAEEIYPFLRSTRGVTVSGRVGLIKPDPEIFKLHAATFDLNPPETLFVDDSAKNIAAAQQLGWHTIHCTADGSVKQEITQFNIEPA